MTAQKINKTNNASFKGYMYIALGLFITLAIPTCCLGTGYIIGYSNGVGENMASTSEEDNALNSSSDTAPRPIETPPRDLEPEIPEDEGQQPTDSENPRMPVETIGELPYRGTGSGNFESGMIAIDSSPISYSFLPSLELGDDAELKLIEESGAEIELPLDQNRAEVPPGVYRIVINSEAPWQLIITY